MNFLTAMLNLVSLLMTTFQSQGLQPLIGIRIVAEPDKLQNAHGKSTHK